MLAVVEHGAARGTRAPARPIGVVAVGDPRAQSTWSGAGRWIVPALERRGHEVVGVDAGTHGWARLPWAARYHARRWWRSPPAAKVDLRLQRRLLGPTRVSDLHWDLALRARRARHAERALRAAGVGRALHLTANALPRHRPAGLRQVVYLDATWASQTLERIPGGPGRYPPSLVAEGVAYERDAFAGVDHVFVQAAWLVDHLAELGVGRDRITAVGTGLRNVERDAPDPPEPARLLLVAKDSPDERGVPLALAALERARGRRRDLCLVVVGHPEYPRRFGHLPGVEAHGYLTPDEVDEQVVRASLLVNLSACQTWGTINGEAMNLRTPILALDRFAIPEITDGGRLGFVVPGADPGPDEVAKVLLDALADRERLRRMGEQARASARARFSWDAMAAAFADALGLGDRDEAGDTEVGLSA